MPLDSARICNPAEAAGFFSSVNPFASFTKPNAVPTTELSAARNYLNSLPWQVPPAEGNKTPVISANLECGPGNFQDYSKVPDSYKRASERYLTSISQKDMEARRRLNQTGFHNAGLTFNRSLTYMWHSIALARGDADPADSPILS